MSDFYNTVGVSAEKGEVHAAIQKRDAGLFPGAFCNLTEDPAGDGAYCAALHADGAGTKSALAYLYWRETGDESVFEDLAQDSLVMNLDDLACVGAVGGFMVSNTIGRNAARVGGSVLARIIDGYDKCAHLLRAQGVDLHMCGGETADVGDLTGTLIVDSTVFCRIEKARVVDCANIVPGDVIVGFASYGKAAFETRYNAGIGSNGLTAARHLLLCADYREKYPETYSSTTDPAMVYGGKWRVTDPLSGTPLCVGRALLSPTRPYVGMLRALFETLPQKSVHGLIHCTGGGQTKCRRFGRGLHYIKDNLFPVPPIFALLCDAGIGSEESFRDFNMGHRLELMCPPDAANAAIGVAESFCIEAKVVGRVEKSEDGLNRVTIVADGKTHRYGGSDHV